MAHSGFGSSLFLPHLYDAPVINFFEYFRRAQGGCIGYRPELPVDEGDVLRCRTSNAMILLDLEACDRGWCPNAAQRDAMPRDYHPKIEVIPEGIDTGLYRRREHDVRRLPDGTPVPAGTRVVTYVSRGFELARGFDIFLAAAKRIRERFPDVLFLVAGTDRPYYMADERATGGKSLRRRVLETGGYDREHFKFVGWLPEDKLVELLSLSDLHVYLTIPFITSWSMLDAMSCGCVVLASDQACTREYVTHGRNGLLCDFFDAEGIADRAVEVLSDPAAYRPLGEAARRTIEEGYSLDVTLPRIKKFFEKTAATGPRVPTMRTQGLVRPAKPAAWTPRRRREGGAPPEPAPELPAFDGAIPFSAVRPSAPCHSERSEESPVTRASDERSFAALRMTEGSGPRRQTERKTVLFCWELGAGLGHLMQMMPLAADLAAAGHCVVVALRHLERAVDVFGRAGVFFLQAPYPSPSPAPGRFPRAAGFGQFLANLTFGDDDALFAHASAWRNLMRSAGPDLVVCDHSPTALVAARAFPDVRRAVIGSGFCVPPDNAAAGSAAPGVWGPLRPGAVAADPAPALAIEAEVLDRVNWLLENWGQAPMDRLARLYGDADETFLTSFPELDHFRDRGAARYWGPVLKSGEGGEIPAWPDAGGGKRVFVYLKATSAAADVLEALARMKCSTLAYLDGASRGARRRFESPAVHVAERRVDVARAAAECDLAVLNGGHGVTVEMLLAGKPLVLVPLVLEQQMTADAVRRLGAGEAAAPRRGEPWHGAAKLDALLRDPAYPKAARRFADRYAAFDPAWQRAAMLRRAEKLLADEPLPGDPSYVTREAELAAV